MATIIPIEGRTIHQIQSGQVIVDLCSVVKELVENSLDAKATNIEIRFKNQGLDSIEVQDNGDGIAPENYETVALKHHTSKLSTFSDLTTLQTYGFRGEALSSLCALSNFTITTCMASEAPKGTKLDFEVSGKLKSTSIVAAQKGTTASVEHLFDNLPVRRRELERNIKREWNRVISLLGQYACIQTGVKMSVTQQSTKGKRATVFSTKGNPSTRENIINVFGAKTLAALLSLNLKLEIEPTSGPSQRWSTQGDGDAKEIHVVGYVSRPNSGEGRQTPDRQMFFVNARPCNLPQIAKAFNEVYRSYNNAQSPFILANIEMDTHLYDVNVSPDKKTILLHDQSRMLEHLKISLTELFESQDHIVPISQFPQKNPPYRQPTISRQDTSSQRESSDGSDSVDRLKSTSPGPNRESQIHHDRFDALPARTTEQDKKLSLTRNWLRREAAGDSGRSAYSNATNENADILSKVRRQPVERLDNEILWAEKQEIDINENSKAPGAKLLPEHSVADVASSLEDPDFDPRSRTTEAPIPAIASPSRRTVSTPIVGSSPSTTKPLRSPTTIATITIGERTVTSALGIPCSKRQRTEKATSNVVGRPLFRNFLSQRFSSSGARHEGRSDGVDFKNISPHLGAEDSGTDEDTESNSRQDEPEIDGLPIPIPAKTPDDDCLDEDEKKAQEEAKVQEMIKAAEGAVCLPGENLRRIQQLFKKKSTTLKLVHSLDITVSEIDLQLRNMAKTLKKYNRAQGSDSKTGNTLDSESAEEILSLTINKSDFASMKVIGQFNLGFILARRSRESTDNTFSGNSIADDLFIIDQHASDEKFNFERLQATTVVQSQRLVHPKPLELTAVEEEIVIENLQSLESNGFLVTVDQSGIVPVGRRCNLVGLPVSRETTFSLPDLEELISLLADYRRPSILGSTPTLTAVGAPPRPSRVRKMFAMRACRSSIMIGRTLTQRQMEKVVRHMGEIDKPWNCPHGRPTLRHLCDLTAWDELGWKEDDIVGDSGGDGVSTDWAGYLRGIRS